MAGVRVTARPGRQRRRAFPGWWALGQRGPPEGRAWRWEPGGLGWKAPWVRPAFPACRLSCRQTCHLSGRALPRKLRHRRVARSRVGRWGRGRPRLPRGWRLPPWSPCFSPCGARVLRRVSSRARSWRAGGRRPVLPCRRLALPVPVRRKRLARRAHRPCRARLRSRPSRPLLRQPGAGGFSPLRRCRRCRRPWSPPVPSARPGRRLARSEGLAWRHPWACPARFPWRDRRAGSGSRRGCVRPAWR